MDVFRRVLAQKNQVSGLEEQIKAHQTEIDATIKGQARIRENMKALIGAPRRKLCCNVTPSNATLRKIA